MYCSLIFFLLTTSAGHFLKVLWLPFMEWLITVLLFYS